MLKKLVTSIFLLSCTSPVFAGFSFYVAPKLSYIGMTSTNNRNEVLVPLLAAGAGVSMDMLYLGGEVFANRRFMTIRNGPNNANDLRPSYQWGVSVLPGIVFDSYSLGYARFGAVSSRFGKIGETKTGVQVGAGLEVKAISTVYLNGEYTYTRYRSLSAVIGAPTSDQFSLGVVFRFPGY